MLQQLVLGQAADMPENEAKSISVCANCGSARQSGQNRGLSLGTEPLGGRSVSRALFGAECDPRSGGVSAGGAPAPAQR